MVSTADILAVVSDEKSLSLFKAIALSKGSSDILLTKIKLTRKQYYSRIEALIKLGLIRRNNGKYFLTLYGKVIYNFHTKIDIITTNYYWKLNALDSIITTSSISAEMPVEEQIKLIDNIIADNNEIKDIILADTTINKEGEEHERRQHRQYINTITDPKNRPVISVSAE